MHWILFIRQILLLSSTWIDHTKLPTWCTEYYLFVKYYYSPLHVSSIKYNKDKIYQKGQNYQKSMMCLDSLLFCSCLDSLLFCSCLDSLLFMLLCNCSYYVSKVFVLCVCTMFIVFVPCVCVCTMFIIWLTGLLDLDAALLARSQNPECPATGHLDPGFLGFPGS